MTRHGSSDWRGAIGAPTSAGRSGRAPAWGAIVALTVALPAAAQQGGSCPGRMAADFGLASVGCTGNECVIARTQDGEREDGSIRFTWIYSIEPEVDEIRSGSPLDGIVRRGDRIVAVDGIPITTLEGSRRLQHAKPGDLVRLTYRRNGRVRETEVRAVPRCAEEEASETALLDRLPHIGEIDVSPPGGGRAADATDVPAVGRPTITATPGVALGLTFECSHCMIQTTPDGSVVWGFSQPIRVLAVEPGGPAARAGLSAGDLVRRIAGHPLESREGGEAFGALRPGVPVRIVFSSPDGSFGSGSLVPDARDDAGRTRRSEGPASGLDEDGPLRFSGTLNGAAVEVRGAPVTVDQMRGEGTITIYTDTNVVRIRVPPNRED